MMTYSKSTKRSAEKTVRDIRGATRNQLKKDVAEYMRYYNVDRLHSANDDLSPVKFELSELKVSTTT